MTRPAMSEKGTGTRDPKNKASRFSRRSGFSTFSGIVSEGRDLLLLPSPVEEDPRVDDGSESVDPNQRRPGALRARRAAPERAEDAGARDERGRGHEQEDVAKDVDEQPRARAARAVQAAGQDRADREQRVARKR